MEAVMLPDQPISPYNSQIRTPKKGMNRPFISRTSENFAPLNLLAGFSQAPQPYLSQSYPPFSLQQQPPLLPLPMSRPQKANTHPQVRGLSCPPTNRKSNNNNRTRPRDSSLTPKKSSKPLATTPKKEENLMKPISKLAKMSSSESVLVSSTNPSGPDPKDLPKDVPSTLSLLSGNSSISTYAAGSLRDIKGGQLDEFSGSVAFSLSPPPSSLPLPTFSLRPKLSCNAEAAGIDAGATDDLRRLLRLR